MFKNKKVTITLDKKDDGTLYEPSDPDHFQKQFDIVLDKLEDFGKKVLIGVAAYIFMDTCRQVTIEKAKKD